MFPRMSLALLPTPIQHLDRLSAQLKGPELLIKRDDLTGLAFGGNKTRKLEYLLADAREQGAELLLTTGAGQSNHCRQTAAAAARAGFNCRLVLTGEAPQTPSANQLLDLLVGASLVWTEPSARDLRLKQEFERAQDLGKKPYLIPYGGSNVIGAYAYYRAVFELKEQLEEQELDWIVFASSSGGTQAGLAAGVKGANWPVNILGISVDEPDHILASRVADLGSQVLDAAGENQRLDEENILVNDDYLGEGYGVMGGREKQAIQTFAREEGILLDPVYTGRAAGGLVNLIRQGFFETDERVLFWHTGGTPVLFADRYLPDLLY